VFGSVTGLGLLLDRRRSRASTPALSGAPAASPRPSPRPRLVQGRYQLPAGATPVIEAIVDNGPLAPALRTGYTVVIDARGHVVVTETPVGAKATPATAAERTTTREFGVAGLQRLLAALDALGFFALPQSGEPGADALLVGGPTREVAVTLADGGWRAEARRLTTGMDQLEAALAAITAAAGVSPTMCAAFTTCLVPGTPEPG
jgi:hypothetical protein